MSNTKKSKDVGEHSYKLGDVVLAKVRGYPRWPAMVVDPDAVPPDVAKERPGNKKTTFYCVRFFPAGDYSWAVSKDLSLLQKHEIEAYINEPHKKSGDLLQGYKIALDPSEWEETLAEQRAAAEEAEADAEVDQLDDGDEEDNADIKRNKVSKKRKRESESKPKKRKEPKKSATAPVDSKKSIARKKSGKKNGIRTKDTVESEDEGADDAEGEDIPAESSKKFSAPAAKKARKDKSTDDSNLDHLKNDPDAAKVKEWRHKLQRAFLSKSFPTPEEMPEYDRLFTTIENYDVTIQQLAFSKLGKVMSHITQLDQNAFPGGDKFSIQKRAKVLFDKWKGLLSAAGDGNAPSGGTANVSAVNGAGVGKSKVEKKNEVPPAATDKEPIKDASVNGDAVDAKATHAAEIPEVSAAAPASEEAVAMDMADD